MIPTLRGVGVTASSSKIHLDRYSDISEKGVTIEFVDDQNPFEGWKIQLGRS